MATRVTKPKPTKTVKPTKAKTKAAAKPAKAAAKAKLTPHQIGALRMWADRKAAEAAGNGKRKAKTAKPVKVAVKTSERKAKPVKVAVKKTAKPVKVTKVVAKKATKPGKTAVVLNDYQLRAKKAWETRRANLLAKGLVKPDGTPSRKEQRRRTEQAQRAWNTRRERSAQAVA
jgi:hypothetical protein